MLQFINYSPFAFASAELEAAFQRDLPRRMGNILNRHLLTTLSLATAIVLRTSRNLSYDSLPLILLLPLSGMLGVIAAAAMPSAAPTLYSKCWMPISVVLRMTMSFTVLLTWDLMPREPVKGPLTLFGGFITFFVVGPLWSLS
jgi:hypothetical protein